MPEFDEQQLKEKLKKEPIGTYLFYGDETYLVKVYTDKFANATADENFRDFNLRIFDGDDTVLSDVYESATAIPMMAESKCVIVRNYEINSKNQDNDLDEIETILKENPEDNCLIFSYPAGTPKGSAFNAMVKLFNKYGVSVNFRQMTKSDLMKVVENGAKKRGKLFEKGVSDYFVTCVGADLNHLNNELEKLCAYAGEFISYHDVDDVCTKSIDAKVFDMVIDLVYGKFDSAFRKLSKLFDNREDEYMILGALISQYADMYRAKAVRESGESSSSLSEYYQSYKNKTFKIDKAAKAASNLTAGQLKKSIEILAGADIALKSTSADKKQVLEQTLVNLARVGR